VQTSIWRLVGGLEGDGLLLAHGGDDGNADLLARLESGLDVGTDLTLGDLDVVLGGTVREHQVEETLRPRTTGMSARVLNAVRRATKPSKTYVVNVDQGVLGPGDVGDVHVVGRGRDILQLLAGEDLITFRARRISQRSL